MGRDAGQRDIAGVVHPDLVAHKVSNLCLSNIGSLAHRDRRIGYHLDGLDVEAFDRCARRGGAAGCHVVDQRLAEVVLCNFIGLLEAEALAGSKRADALLVICEVVVGGDAV